MTISKCVLDSIVRKQKQGNLIGITSVCSANPTVLKATFGHALATGEAVLVESTCNQVNQYGGYTGQTPIEFKNFLVSLADSAGFPQEQLIIGGDHLGPSVWQNEPAAEAMEKALILVRDKVLAGYVKIHLDASMRCADDPQGRPLDPRISAARAADLAEAAEAAYCQRNNGLLPRYVIGTEVPPPGGIQHEDEAMRITPPIEVEETIKITRAAFAKRGLDAAWERVMAVVVQPGVEYGDHTIYDYDRPEAVPLARYIENVKGIVYEAHSTDYQTRDALRELVEDHFAILKVGPALTFAFREAVFALAMIEEEWLGKRSSTITSDVREALDAAMIDNPRYWSNYYTGSANDQVLARKYSLSDRSRYYWPAPTVQRSLSKLIANLQKEAIPLSLISQFLPVQYWRVREGRLQADPQSLIEDHIHEVLADYSFACQGAKE